GTDAIEPANADDLRQSPSCRRVRVPGPGGGVSDADRAAGQRVDLRSVRSAPRRVSPATGEQERQEEGWEAMAGSPGYTDHRFDAQACGEEVAQAVRPCGGERSQMGESVHG